MRGIKTKSKIKTSYFVTAISIFSLAAFYVFLTNSMAGDRFEREILSQKISELAEKNAVLELEGEQTQSLSALKKRSRELGLESSDRVGYVQVRGGELVLKSQ